MGFSLGRRKITMSASPAASEEQRRLAVSVCRRNPRPPVDIPFTTPGASGKTTSTPVRLSKGQNEFADAFDMSFQSFGLQTSTVRVTPVAVRALSVEPQQVVSVQRSRSIGRCSGWGATSGQPDLRPAALKRACYFSPERRRLRLERRPQASAGSASRLPGALDQWASDGHSCEWVEGKRAEPLAGSCWKASSLAEIGANVAKAFRAPSQNGPLPARSSPPPLDARRAPPGHRARPRRSRQARDMLYHLSARRPAAGAPAPSASICPRSQPRPDLGLNLS